MNIIPKINYLEEKAGGKTISATSAISCAPTLQKAAALLEDMLSKAMIAPPKQAKDGDIRFVEDPSLGKEAYRLTIDEKAIVVEASAFSGAFYAVQSLRQLLELDLKEHADTLQAPCLAVSDSPRFSWRGLNLDEARHFFGKDEVKRLLDLMAMHKLNIFHWHLTDDQGWRVEIKKYPRLTEIGSKRADSAVGGWHQNKKEGKPHGGFYTQEDIKELVQYAADRGITVVPEIDMPAHFTAAFAAYPWLACRETDVDVLWHFGGAMAKKASPPDWNRSACIGKDTTFTFIYNILDELFPLFPGEYIHIGGDEAPKEEWKKCPLCQKRMKEHNLANEEELQGYFTNKINEYVNSHGKRLIGWNEVLKAKGLNNTVLVEYWTPQKDKNVKAYLERGGKVISCKHEAFYFDMCYSQYPLRNTYYFEKKVKDILTNYPDQIVGVEGHLWTEWVSDREKLDTNLFPRMAALAESGWGDGKNRDYKEFKSRISHFEPVLDKLGVNYAADAIVDPVNPIKRLYEMAMWMYVDQHRDVKANRKQKANKS